MTILTRSLDFGVSVFLGKFAGPVVRSSLLERGQGLNRANAAKHGKGGFQILRLYGQQNGRGFTLGGDDEVARAP